MNKKALSAILFFDYIRRCLFVHLLWDPRYEDQTRSRAYGTVH